MAKVVDTNVLIVASLLDLENDHRAPVEHPISPENQEKVYLWLDNFMFSEEPLCLDTSEKIRSEYFDNLTPQDFASFLIEKKWNYAQVHFFDVEYDRNGHAELSRELLDIVHDPSDRKFVAVADEARKQGIECTIVNAADTDWHDWVESLKSMGFEIEFLIPEYSRKVWEKKKIKTSS